MLRGLGWLAIAVVLFAGAVVYAIRPPGKPHGYAGMEFMPLTPAAAARTPLLEKGALIRDVAVDSPAARAGIKPGEVVAAIDGTRIVSAAQASDLVRAARSGAAARLTLFDITQGEVKPRAVTLVFEEAPKAIKSFSVDPPRTLAKEYFQPPGIAANASWSRRIARGAFIRPRALFGLGDGHCNGFAPEKWEVRGHAGDDSLFHIAAHAGFQHAIFAAARIGKRDPEDFILELLKQQFGAPALMTPRQPRSFGFTRVDFGNLHGVAGFALYRVQDGVITVWLAAVPGADVAWAKPLVGAIALSLHCQSPLMPAARSFDPALSQTSVSVTCLNGACQAGDFASTILKVLQFGYVHNAKGAMFLINPRRDYWISGADGPGYYHQIGGENEKLEPGRTN